MRSSPYAAHDTLVAPARAAPEVWRLIAGLGVVALVVVGLNISVQRLLLYLAPDFYMRDFATAGAQGTTPASMMITLYSFAFVILGTVVAAKLLHQRDWRTLTGPPNRAVAQFLRTAFFLAVLGAALLVLPPYGSGMETRPNTRLSLWLPLLPLSLIGVLIQTASEEVLFRGYIQQQLAARSKNPLVWMVLPALVFGAGHYLPGQAGDNALFIASWTVLFGILMADLTARAGTLGPAVAVHMANNVSALLLVSLPDSLSGLSLYVTTVGASDPSLVRAWLPVEFVMTLILWLTARLAIRR